MPGRQARNVNSVHRMSVHTAFESLAEAEKLYAHHLARATWCGARIILEQTSPESNDVFDYIMECYRLCNGDWNTLAKKASLETTQVESFVEYAATFLSNVGNYYGRGDQKFVPRVAAEALRSISLLSPKVGKLWERVEDDMYCMPPYSLGFPSDVAQSQYYPRGSSSLQKPEVEAVSRVMESKAIWPENTRLRKYDYGKGCEIIEILQASIEPEESVVLETGADSGPTIHIKRGDHHNALSKICFHLEEASKHTTNDKQIAVLQKYIETFTTGDMEAYRESQRSWVQDKYPPVELILGFVEPYRDPAGIRAEFEGLVAIENPEESKVLKEFVQKSDNFIRQLPWARGTTENDGKGPFEKAVFDPPSFASVHALSYCSSILFDGINLPNFNDIRQTGGFKNVLIANRMAANSRRDTPCPFVNDDEVEEFMRHQYHAQYLWLVVHELLGHGTGQMMVQENETKFNFDPRTPPNNPLTGLPIHSWYKPGQTWTGQFGDLATAVDECRCELVGAYLMDNTDLLAHFGFTTRSQLKADDMIYHFYMHLCTSALTALRHYIVESKKWGQAHSRAHFAMLKCLLRGGDGCVRIDHNAAGGRLKVVLDSQRIVSHGKPALERMLLMLHMYRVTADAPACRLYFEDLSAVEDEHLEWRRSLLSRNVPGLNYVHGNTFLERDRVHLKEYEPTGAGIIQSWFERGI